MESLILLLTKYRYYILLPLAVVEGPILAVVSGFFCRTGFFHLRTTYPILLAGDVIGDSMYYAIGYWGTQGFLKKQFNRLRLSERKANQITGFVKTNLFRSVLLSKVLLGIGFTGLFVMGRMRVSYKRFIIFCFLVSILQCAAYLSVGWFFGVFYEQINRVFGYVASL